MNKDLSDVLHVNMNGASYRRFCTNYYERITPAIDSYCNQHICEVAKWIDGNGKSGLLLMGNVGNGKTTLGRATMSYIWKCLKDRYNLMGIQDAAGTAKSELALQNANDILLQAMQDYPKTIFGYSDKKCLMVDDAGKEQVSINMYGNSVTPVIDIMERIYARENALIMTTNLDTRGLREKYGERVYDRLKETMHVVTFTNPSYR